MEAECESEVQVASVAVVESSEETTLSAETQETTSVEMSSSESNIETTESQETSHEVSVSGHEVSESVESEETLLDGSQSVTTEEEIVRESSENVEVVEVVEDLKEDLKTREISEHTENVMVVRRTENQSSDSEGTSTMVFIKETEDVSEDGSKVFKVDFSTSNSNLKSVQVEYSSSIVITNAEGSSEVQNSFVSTKEIISGEITTNTEENEEKLESIEDKSDIKTVHEESSEKNEEKLESIEEKSDIETVHEESSEETKEIIESNQCMEMQAEEQTSLEVGKIVSDEKIICQVNDSNDADEVQDTHDEVPGGEADEQSATPDLIKACNEINKTMNGSANIMEVNIKIIHCHSNQYLSPFNSDCEDYLRMNAYRRLVVGLDELYLKTLNE